MRFSRTRLSDVLHAKACTAFQSLTLLLMVMLRTSISPAMAAHLYSIRQLIPLKWEVLQEAPSIPLNQAYQRAVFDHHNFLQRSSCKMQLWKKGLWKRGLWKFIAFASFTMIFMLNQRLGQIMGFAFSIGRIRIDVNSSDWRWLIKIPILKYAKGLNFLVFR